MEKSFAEQKNDALVALNFVMVMAREAVRKSIDRPRYTELLDKAWDDLHPFIEGSTGYAPKPEPPLKWEPLPDPEGGAHMTKEEWLKAVECGGFIDYDGFGCYASETQMTNREVYPSDVEKGKFDPSYTHIVWFNR